MIKQAGTPHQYCGEALNHTACFYNRTALRALNMRFPYDSFLGKAPILSKLRVFGCQVYAHVHNANGETKLHDHAESGVHLRIDGGQYRVGLMGFRRVITI